MVPTLSSVARAALLAVAALVVALPAPASAHAAYKDSDPPDEGTVSSPPSSVWAEFTEPPAEGSSLRIYDPCGARVDGGDDSISGYRITVSMAAQASGTYTVEYFVTSTLDGHPTQGKFTFAATSGAACGGGGGSSSGRERGDRGDKGSPGGTTGADGGGAEGGAGAPGGAVGSADGEAPGKDARGDRGAVRSGHKDHAERAGDDGVRDLAGERRTADRNDSILDGFPVDGLVIALALAVLIGAAGGKVYAGIMGYRR